MYLVGVVVEAVPRQQVPALGPHVEGAALLPEKALTRHQILGLQRRNQSPEHNTERSTVHVSKEQCSAVQYRGDYRHMHIHSHDTQDRQWTNLLLSSSWRGRGVGKGKGREYR